MANTMQTVTDLSSEFSALSGRMRDLYWDVKRAISANQTASIDWGNATKPAIINENVDGNIDGTNFSRTDLSNAIGSFSALATLVEQGHLGNLEKLAAVLRT